MHNYDSLRQKHSTKVCQTIDSPIMVFDYFELGEVFAALSAMMLFGIVLYSWKMLFLSSFLILGVGPVVRRSNNKGVFVHWPYRHLRMSLPGLINPHSNKKYSD